jgi:hypothetical protein
MGIDIKFPIGLMFSILGLLISVYGLFTMNNPIYQKSFGININLWSCYAAPGQKEAKKFSIEVQRFDGLPTGWV